MAFLLSFYTPTASLFTHLPIFTLVTGPTFSSCNVPLSVICRKESSPISFPFLSFYYLSQLNFFFFFYFTVLYWFCYTSTWICHRPTRVPHPEPRSHLPPCTIPPGHPSAPAPSILYPALNVNGRFVSYMILYMFQCHSSKSPPSLSHRVQKTVQHYAVVYEYIVIYLTVRSCWTPRSFPVSSY